MAPGLRDEFNMRLKDRRDAGKLLASALQAYARQSDAVVLALPKGGVAVAFEVARALGLPLDIFGVGKLGFPGQPELALGAVTIAGDLVLNSQILADAGLSRAAVEEDVAKVRRRLENEDRLMRLGHPLVDVAGKHVLLIDDGLATGATVRAAVFALRKTAATITVAVPVASPEAKSLVEKLADQFVCLQVPAAFRSVGSWYIDFPQLDVSDVRELLRAANPGAMADPLKNTWIPSGGIDLRAQIQIPAGARGVVLFAHGSGSGIDSPRNQTVAAALRNNGFATVLLDLLTEDEIKIDGRTAHLRFDIPLLGSRFSNATAWVAAQPDLADLPLGCFGASTGAASAAIAAAEYPEAVCAIVSRGGRVDLAQEVLPKVHSAVLLIVGSEDHDVLTLNRNAMPHMAGRCELSTIQGAGHLFEEEGALAQVTELAVSWYRRFLV